MINQTAKTLDRTQAQCERILNAAEQCFIKYGFHAASMANISEVAGMSPGLIYRYFDNKSAIIKAIIERQLGMMRADISALLGGADFIGMIADMFASWRQGNSRVLSPVLYLELSAEATRDKEIAEAAKLTDGVCATALHAGLKQLAEKGGYHLTDAEVEQRDFILRCLLDGLAVRAVRDPALDPALVADSLELFLPKLLALADKK